LYRVAWKDTTGKQKIKPMELGFIDYLPTYVEFPTKAKVNINGFSP